MDRVFEEAWREAQAGLRRYALRLCEWRDEGADELLASTALKALLYLRRHPCLREHAVRFLFTVLRHVFLDSQRGLARDRQLFDDAVALDESVHADLPAGEPGASPLALQQLERVQQLARVDACLERASGAQRQLFQWRFVEEVPYAQIAQRLGISQALARKRIQSLRGLLRTALCAE